MALQANAIVTLAEAKQQLNITTSNTNEDDLLTSWINETSDEVEHYCNRLFVSQSVTSEIHDGDGTSVIYPRYFPLQQLSVATAPTSADILAAVQYRTSPDDTWTDIETDTDHIFYDTGDTAKRCYIELYDEYFDAGRRNIKLVYKAGYATVPSDVKKVVLEKIQVRWNESKHGNDWLGQSNINESQVSGSLSLSIQRLDERWNAILDRYRIKPIG